MSYDVGISDMPDSKTWSLDLYKKIVGTFKGFDLSYFVMGF